MKKELEQVTKNIDMITRERDISQKNFVKSTGSSIKQFNSLKLSEQNKRNLEQEIIGYKDEAQKMRKVLTTFWFKIITTYYIAYFYARKRTRSPIE